MASVPPPAEPADATTAQYTLRARLGKAYRRGASIRQLAEANARSYSTVRGWLVEDGVKLRPRGGQRGPRRGKR